MSGFGGDIIVKCLEKTWTALTTDQHYDFQVSDEKILEKNLNIFFCRIL